MLGPALALLLATTAHARQRPTDCADNTMTSWMRNSAGKTPCELVQDVLRVCDPSVEIGFLPRNYACDNGPGSALSPCCCGGPTFALMSACWSCQYNITFDLVTTTFTGFEKDCPSIPDPICSYDPSVRTSINALDLPAWSRVEPLAGRWDMAGAWKNATPFPTAPPPVPTGYPITVQSTGISKGALAGAIIGAILGSGIFFMLAGYMFWRWWRAQPTHQPHDEDEKGYAQRVLGSRGQVDLDEDTTPRSSRWLGVPSYLKPTSFHSRSSHSHSRSDSPSGRFPDDLTLGRFPPDPQFDGAGTGQPGDVTPFEGREPAGESEKARTRRSLSMRVTNDLPGPGSVPRPQPALLATARRLSVSNGGSSPQSPSAPLTPLPLSPQPLSHSSSLVLQNLSNSRSHSSGSGRGYQEGSGSGQGHQEGFGSGQGYQEDDAGVSLVIESGHSSPNLSDSGMRSVPPAYVDYRTGYSYDYRTGGSFGDSRKGYSNGDSRKGYSNGDSRKGYSNGDSRTGNSNVDYRTGYSRADKAPKFEWRPSGSVEGTSESATCIGSGSSNPTRAGSVEGKPGPSAELRSELGTGVRVEERDEVRTVEERTVGERDEARTVGSEVRTVGERDEGEVQTVTDRAIENGGSSVPRTRAGTPHLAGAESDQGRDEPDVRDRSESVRNRTGDEPRRDRTGNDSDARDKTGDDPNARDKTGDDLDARDRTASGDSEGTIKTGAVDPPKPLEMSSTTDLVALTAVNTAANRSSGPDAGPSAVEQTQPNPTRQASAPAGVTLSEHAESTPESNWTWGRALGVFGIGAPGTPPTKD